MKKNKRTLSIRNILRIITENQYQYYNSKDVQTYIKPIYLYHSYIKIYKRNSIEFPLLYCILFILIYYNPYLVLVVLL